MKILVMEDEKMLADSIKAMLQHNGFQVECVYDGEAGKEYAQLGIYDLLILDVMMPKMDGLEVETSTLQCAGKTVRLTAKEFDVMRLLLQSGKRNLSKSAIISYVWGLESNAVEKLVFVLPKACKRGRMYV